MHNNNYKNPENNPKEQSPSTNTKNMRAAGFESARITPCGIKFSALVDYPNTVSQPLGQTIKYVNYELLLGESSELATYLPEVVMMLREMRYFEFYANIGTPKNLVGIEHRVSCWFEAL